MDIQILASAFAASLVHTLIPSHWLVFVLVGRAHNWSRAKTLIVTATAGFLHIVSTVILGFLVTIVGHHVADIVDFDRISAGFLILIGIIYLAFHLFHREGDVEDHCHSHALPEKPSVGALFLMLTVSPCETVLPMFFVASGAGIGSFIALSAVIMVTTVGAMLTLVAISYKGMEKIKFHFIEHNEKFVIGVILCLMGIAMILLRS